MRANDPTLINSAIKPGGHDRPPVGIGSDELDALPATLRVFVRLGADGASSGGFRLFIDCDGPFGDLAESTTTDPGAGRSISEGHSGTRSMPIGDLPG